MRLLAGLDVAPTFRVGVVSLDLTVVQAVFVEDTPLMMVGLVPL